MRLIKDYDRLTQKKRKKDKLDDYYIIEEEGENIMPIADPFATPLEILPEWYFFSTFNMLRVIPNKLLGVLSMAAVPAGLLTVPFIENINKYQNPFRRPVATTVFIFGTFVAIWLGIGATLPIDNALTLGLF